MPAPQDLVFQTSTTTGTADLDLNASTYRAFSDAFGTGNTNTFDYYIVNVSVVSPATAEWEIGTGYINASTSVLVRDQINLSSAKLTGTYSQSTTTITVTITSHGLTTGNKIYLDFTSGTATDGPYTVNVTGTNTFTVTSATSATTSGNVTLYKKTTFSSGTKNVTNDIPSNYQVRTSTNSVTNNHAVVFDGTTGSLVKSAGISLGTIASQAANSVAITGGSISGLSPALPVGSGGTGLSTLTEGDILYSSATDTLAKLAKATNGNVLKLASGLPSWGNPFSVGLRTLTSSTTYTPTPGTIAAIVILTGGGGGGSGAMASGTNSRTTSGGGGGAGATVIAFLTATQIGTSQSVTIGAAGAAGTSTTTANSTSTGGNGTQSLFGSLLTAGGGLGGTVTIGAGGSAAGTGGAGGTGSATISPVLTINGQTGSDGTGTHISTSNYPVATGGAGGASFWGGGGSPVSAVGTNTAIVKVGRSGVAYGSGGGGGALSTGSSTATGNTSGGVGAAGVCAIFEFIAA